MSSPPHLLRFKYDHSPVLVSLHTRHTLTQSPVSSKLSFRNCVTHCVNLFVKLSTMPDQPGKRKAEQASWEQYSEIIEELFITGGKTMEDIRKILSEEYGFDRRFALYGR